MYVKLTLKHGEKLNIFLHLSCFNIFCSTFLHLCLIFLLLFLNIFLHLICLIFLWYFLHIFLPTFLHICSLFLTGQCLAIFLNFLRTLFLRCYYFVLFLRTFLCFFLRCCFFVFNLSNIWGSFYYFLYRFNIFFTISSLSLRILSFGDFNFGFLFSLYLN